MSQCPSAHVGTYSFFSLNNGVLPSFLYTHNQSKGWYIVAEMTSDNVLAKNPNCIFGL
jgi:hypothetical protein